MRYEMPGIRVLLLAAVMALVVGACAFEQGEETQGDVGPYDPESAAEEVRGQEQAFLTNPSPQYGLIQWAKQSSAMYICIDGPGVNAANWSAKVADVKNAILAWIAPAREVATVPLITAADIYIDCTYWDAKVIYLTEAGGTRPSFFTRSTNTITLYSDDNDFATLLHEMGHAFRLADTYETDEDGNDFCMDGQLTSVMCSGGSVLRFEDRAAIQELYCIANSAGCKRRKQANLGWCMNPAKLLVGDFNGDGREDLLCRTPSGLNMAWLMDTTGWFSSSAKAVFSWCTQGQVFVGNFNGDAYDDLLCHNPSNGDKAIAYGTSTGTFQATWSAAAGWCSHSTGELLVGDFDGDGRDDILCHDVLNGRLWTWHANTSGTFTGARPPYDFPSNINFCLGTYQHLKVGKFSPDLRSDLVCVNTANGGIRTAFATPSGLFTSANASELPSWCHAGYGQIFVGDVSGNGSDDLVCHRGSFSPDKEIAFSYPDGSFRGKSRVYPMNWCVHSAGQFLLGNFNGGKATDFLCTDTSNGYKWMSYSTNP